MNPIDWLDYELFGNAILGWGTAVGVFVVVFLALLLQIQIIKKQDLVHTYKSIRNRKEDTP